MSPIRNEGANFFGSQAWRTSLKWLMILISVLQLLVGLLTLPLPVPIGLPIFLLDLALLVRYSSVAKKVLLRLSRRHTLLHETVNRLRSKGKACENAAEDRVD